ncbi:hypothetical protein MAR_036716 [Mya arenaria]|uniref:Uncharacterized protein n=1 Tax=Mya arenaria TaxID=6604 RepID=A0ABY7FLN1_MYAAR|nr:uncharacterized protein LOC128212848 [Mya arenaria]WAR23047.1 hypothetical protein MAR_036716 [Mya arenaria]
MEDPSRKLSSDSVPDIHIEPADDYTASIELSNACREFYRNRVKATENFKQNMKNRTNNDRTSTTTKRTSIDDAMVKLRGEMASLMDQDLSLMKQLLTLNEAIEDLKTKRLYHLSKDSLRASSQDLHASDLSVSETDMYETDDENEKKTLDIKDNYQTSSLSLPVPLTKENKFHAHMGLVRKSDIAIVVTDNGHRTVKHEPQSSLDSGYGDDTTYGKLLLSHRGPVEVTI